MFPDPQAGTSSARHYWAAIIPTAASHTTFPTEGRPPQPNRRLQRSSSLDLGHANPHFDMTDSSSARHPTATGGSGSHIGGMLAPNPINATNINAGGVVIDERPPQQKRRNLSLASISIATSLTSGLSILKRKPLPVNSPVHQQRSASIDSPRSINRSLPVPANLLSPIPSPRSADIVVRDLDQYALPCDLSLLLIRHCANLRPQESSPREHSIGARCATRTHASSHVRV